MPQPKKAAATKKRTKRKVQPIRKETEKSITPAAYRVEQWLLDRITPYEKNARRIPHAAIDKVALSLQEFGWRQPIVVDQDGVIVVGHTRLLAAQKLGLTHAPVHVATDLTPRQIAAYRLMDNRSHQETEWDYDLLRPELLDLGSLEDFDMALTGFDLNEIDLYLKGPSFGPVSADDQGRLDQKKPCICPACGHEFVAS